MFAFINPTFMYRTVGNNATQFLKVGLRLHIKFVENCISFLCIVQASLAANTFAVQGHAEIKREYFVHST